MLERMRHVASRAALLPAGCNCPHARHSRGARRGQSTYRSPRSYGPVRTACCARLPRVPRTCHPSCGRRSAPAQYGHTRSATTYSAVLRVRLRGRGQAPDGCAPAAHKAVRERGNPPHARPMSSDAAARQSCRAAAQTSRFLSALPLRCRLQGCEVNRAGRLVRGREVQPLEEGN